jgi:Plasmid encoded RepA protein
MAQRIFDRESGLADPAQPMQSPARDRRRCPGARFRVLGFTGPKPRLILCYLNTQAILSKSPIIEVENSLSAFVERIGLDRHGRNMRTVKGQLARLAAADFKFGTFTAEGRARTVKATVVQGSFLRVMDAT